MKVFADKDALARIQEATDYPLQRALDGRVVGHFFHCRLSSVFQPVFDVIERQVVGHAAYVRTDATDDGGLRRGGFLRWRLTTRWWCGWTDCAALCMH